MRLRYICVLAALVAAGALGGCIASDSTSNSDSRRAAHVADSERAATDVAIDTCYSAADEDPSFDRALLPNFRVACECIIKATLRDYGIEGLIGKEPTAEQIVEEYAGECNLFQLAMKVAPTV